MTNPVTGWEIVGVDNKLVALRERSITGTQTSGTQPDTGGGSGGGSGGGAIAIAYTFSTTTTDSDPGNGNLRLNTNSPQSSATTIRADLLSSDGTDWSSVLATFDDSTNTVKGYIKLVKVTDSTKWLLYTVSALASPSGYKNITVANVGASGALANGDAIFLEFDRVGDAGSGFTGNLYVQQAAPVSPADGALWVTWV